MKKVISTMLTAALVAGTFLAVPANSYASETIYEFEDGAITDVGDNITAVVTMSGASGGNAVDLKDSGDSVALDINAASSGAQKLTIRYSQPYDENGKYQDVIVNGRIIGQIFCAYTGEGRFSTVSVSANLNAGANTVTIQGSWGWTYLDSLTIEEENSANTSVSGKLSNPNASAETQSLYSFVC